MKLLTPIVALLTAALLAGCGGSASPAGTPAAPAALAVRGAISSRAAGTMTVSGLAIDTGAAVIRIETSRGPSRSSTAAWSCT
jgi:hypothetical protein